MTDSDENGRTKRQQTTDPDASAGWETEYAAQGVEHAIATDGGAERPEDCGCWNVDQDLPCWACYRDGFDTQNPAEPAADDDSEHAEEADDAATLEAFADGGRADALPSPGDRVRDRDSDDSDERDELVVVEVDEETTAAECWLDAINATVADVNGAYDPEAAVVEAAYVADVEDRLDGWRTVEDLRDAVSFGALSLYTFPADRLAARPGGAWR